MSFYSFSTIVCANKDLKPTATFFINLHLNGMRNCTSFLHVSYRGHGIGGSTNSADLIRKGCKTQIIIIVILLDLWHLDTNKPSYIIKQKMITGVQNVTTVPA